MQPISNFKIALILLAIITSAVSGCAKSSVPSLGGDEHHEEAWVPVDRAENAPIAERSLEADILTLQKSNYIENCDIRVFSQQLEVARALDRMRDAIRLYDDTVQYLDSEIKKFGPVSVRILKSTVRAKGKWSERRDSWSEIYSAYAKIKNEPVNKSWINLNRRVRSILVNDFDRLVDFQNVWLDEVSAPYIFQAIKQTEACLDQTRCLQPTYSDDVQNFLAENPRYSETLYQLKNGSLVELRESVGKVLRRLQHDAQRFAFIRNGSVERLSRGVLVLPLDSGVFRDAEPQIKALIEEKWSSLRLKVRVVWVSGRDDVFRFVASRKKGIRPYVAFKQREIVLSDGMRIQSIAHEIGHVLGFRDRYFDVWRPQTCEWGERTFDRDLMSNSETGEVTVNQWSELDHQYPLLGNSK